MFIIVPPIESELSCSTGTFLNNYGIRDRKPTFFITCSTVRKRAKRTWDTTVETTKILGKSPKTTKIPLWGNGCHFKNYRVLSASRDETHPITNFVKSVFYFTLSVKQQYGFQANSASISILSCYLKIFLYSSIIELEYRLK